MKIRNKKDALVMGGLMAGTVLAIVILTFETTSGAIPFISLVLIVAGVLMFAILLHTTTKPETELLADERVTRINEKAGYVAFWLVLILITLLFWSDRVWSLGVKLVDVYYAAMSGMISWSVLRWYYNKKRGVV